MTKTLSTDETARLERFLRPPRIAVVATIGPSGMSQLSPNWYWYTDGRLIISTTKDRVKYRNLSRDNRIVVCIYSEPEAAEYVTVRGFAEITDDDSIWPDTRVIEERYVAAELVDANLREMRNESRVLISVAPESVVFGGLDA